MKNKFLSRFDSDNLRKTIIYFLIAVTLIAISLLVGLTDNFLTITMLLIGIVLFLYTVLHLWGKSTYYGILAAVCLVILILDFIWPFISEGIAMAVGLVCFAGIIAGIIGMLRFRKYD
jgi:predicted anti-sigma-YlaC factor YlaD